MPLKERDTIPMSDPRVAQIGHPAPPWMVNYADLMTELVCFFVILYALSAALAKPVQEAKAEVEETMKEEKISGEVKVDKDGMSITITEQGENVFFHSGSADLSPRMTEVMAKFSPTLMKLTKEGYEIIVEGHTDNVPIRTREFASNWELSTARATHVVKYMISDLDFPPGMLAAIGYGEYRPVASNDAEEDRAKNRRVVFFIKNKPIKPAEEKKKKEEGAKETAVPASEGEETSPGEGTQPEGASAPAAEAPTTESELPLPRQAE